MRWEDQEVNYATETGEIKDTLMASCGVLRKARKKKGKYIRVDQGCLDTLIEQADLSEEIKETKIERFCLYHRLMSGIGPGGEAGPTLGIMHYWVDSKSYYGIFQFSPQNDWIDVMTIKEDQPNKAPQTTSASARV